MPQTDTLEGGRFVRTSYAGCAGGAAAVLYAMVDGGHGWPNPASREAPFATTRAIWAFLVTHAPP